MKLHALIHGPSDGLGQIGPGAVAAGHTVTATRLYAGEILPDPATLDLLVIMGGAMSIHQHRDHPWLVPEKRFIAAALGLGKKMLGVCLGGQLIADALGARVYQHGQKEIGWFPVRRVATAGVAAAFPKEMTAFHWHGDTFEIPRGAVRIAESEACANQAFSFGERVLGVQFHLEVTPESVPEFIAGGEADLVAAPFVQTPEEILRSPAGFDHSVLPRVLAALAQLP